MLTWLACVQEENTTTINTQCGDGILRPAKVGSYIATIMHFSVCVFVYISMHMHGWMQMIICS